ncbi:MAG: permease-like cell division protein FtsX [Candidatus Paceibacterota bacterium]
MLWVKIKRGIKSGLISFLRNGYVSLAAILIMVITLFMISGIIFAKATFESTLDVVKNKVDINIYFIPEAPEDDIIAIKKQIENLPEVSKVDYISRQDVLDNFKTAHADDETNLQALQELPDNPFGARLNIKAKEPSQYAGVATFLENQHLLSKDGIPIVEKVNYQKNKLVIDRLSNFINSADRIGYFLTLLFIIVSIAITFNTIRLAIFISKDEIAVMKLVGASNRYIRWPFVVSGVVYGFLSALIVLILLYPITFWLGPKTQDFFAGMNVFKYYASNFGQIFLILMSSGIFIGAISSYLAVRKHLKV